MSETSCLLIIDAQIDFCPGGALAVAGGDEIMPALNELQKAHAHVVLTQDWHPANHASFASQHEGKAAFEMVEMAYGPQVLWPDHCVQATHGASFHAGLDVTKAELIIRKGFRRAIDSYSAFFENDRTTPTGLHGFLQERGLGKITMAGLATDYCVAFSALDAARLGYEVEVVMAACRAIDLNGSLEAQINAMQAVGVRLV